MHSQSQSRAHTQDQSRARLRIGGRLVLLVALLSSALVSGAAMAKAQAPVQTEYRYDAAGNLKSVTVQSAKHSPGDTDPQPLLWAVDNPSESQLSAIEVPAGDGLPGGMSVSIERDDFGKPTRITRGGHGVSVTRSYVYDEGQRLCKTVVKRVRP